VVSPKLGTPVADFKFRNGLVNNIQMEAKHKSNDNQSAVTLINSNAK